MHSSIRKFLALAGLFLALASWAQSRLPTHYIEIQTASREGREAISRLGYAIDEIRSDRTYVSGTLQDVERLKRLNFVVRSYSLQDHWAEIERKWPRKPKSLRYTSTKDVYKKLEQIAKEYPRLVSLYKFGTSVEGRPMVVARLSSKTIPEAEMSKTPVVFFLGCHHAREPLSVEVPLNYISYLAANYGKHPDITRLMDTREIYIAPLTNPDGHAYDYTNGITGKMWRKNRHRNADKTFGVDLNRNYGWGWGGGGTSSDPSSDIYKGTAPFSEPETQAVKNFIDAQPRMKTLISFHTFSELVLYPWGDTYDKVGDKEGFKEDLPIFQKMAGDMAHWNGYTPQQSSDLYIAAGDTTDWAYGQHRIFAFTFELSPDSMWGGGFYPEPAETIPKTIEANLKPMLYMMEYADDPSRVLREKVPSFLVSPIRKNLRQASYQDLSF